MSPSTEPEPQRTARAAGMRPAPPGSSGGAGAHRCDVVASTIPFQRFHHGPREQRDHQLVMAGDLVATTAARARGPLDHVHAWAVVPHHVEVGGDELARA